MRIEKEYQVENIVVLRDDLLVGVEYGNCELVREMKKYIGQTVEILDIDEDGDFQIDDEGWHYSVEMIDEEATGELNEKTHERKYKVGGRVTIREDLEVGIEYGGMIFYDTMITQEGNK